MKATILLLGLLFVGPAFGQGKVPTKAEPMGKGSPDPKTLKNLQADWESAQASFAKHPKDPKVRDRYVVAGVKFGHESMVSPLLGARVKYRQALHVYLQVLKVDPKNPIAKPEADEMIRIYKSMGRPVPH